MDNQIGPESKDETNQTKSQDSESSQRKNLQEAFNKQMSLKNQIKTVQESQKKGGALTQGFIDKENKGRKEDLEWDLILNLISKIAPKIVKILEDRLRVPSFMVLSTLSLWIAYKQGHPGSFTQTLMKEKSLPSLSVVQKPKINEKQIIASELKGPLNNDIREGISPLTQKESKEIAQILERWSHLVYSAEMKKIISGVSSHIVSGVLKSEGVGGYLTKRSKFKGRVTLGINPFMKTNGFNAYLIDRGYQRVLPGSLGPRSMSNPDLAQSAEIPPIRLSQGSGPSAPFINRPSSRLYPSPPVYDFPHIEVISVNSSQGNVSQRRQSSSQTSVILMPNEGTDPAYQPSASYFIRNWIRGVLNSMYIEFSLTRNL